MHIVGTAGHVDHGKSSLVQALTGTNPDRWAEEQLRGMTLDLGFAHLQFPDGVEAGIVDVPGHERFLHNMLAGAAGMELLLLVVAADEGVMPQTLEHLAILRYLSVRKTLVVVTKIDRAPQEQRAAALARIARELKATIAEGVDALPVSITSGEGLSLLSQRIHDELLFLPPRNVDAPAFLPIDRVFSLAGRGTIVTGTLMQGTIRSGDALKIEPGSTMTRARSLQTFGRTIETARAGCRLAINIPGLETRDVVRGDVIGTAELKAFDRYAVRFQALPPAAALLKTRNAVRIYIGSAEILGTLVLSSAPAAGESVEGTLHLRKAAAAYPGTPFVVRRVSPKTLLGGGTIGGTQTEGVAAMLRNAAPQALVLETIARAANLSEASASSAVDVLVRSGDVLALERPPSFIDGPFARATIRKAEQFLEKRHAEEPWAIGATSLAIARALQLPEGIVVQLLGAATSDQRIVGRMGYYAMPSHVPKLSAEQKAFFERHLPADASAPFAPVPLQPVAAALRRERTAGLPAAFDTLIARRELVKVGDHLYRGAQIAQIRTRLESFFAAHREMTMAQFRDVVGTSRKYAVPLLEWFDARGITVRSGDVRLLRASGGSPPNATEQGAPAVMKDDQL